MSGTPCMTPTIKVSQDLVMDPPEFIFPDNPLRPLHTFATIDRGVAPDCAPFRVTDLAWCAQKRPKPVPSAIKYGPVMVAVVCSLDASDIGSRHFRIRTRPTGLPQDLGSTEKYPAPVVDPRQGVQDMMAVSGPVIIRTGA